MPPDEDWFDSDIASMGLTYGEKSGLQIYRNYTKSFEDRAIKRFRDSLSREKLDLGGFTHLTEFLILEDVRFIPVIACGYADDVLKSVFSETLPADVPGGINDMLSGYGPLSDFSKRIKMAFAFDVLSSDLMVEFNLVRKVRNKISHDWNFGTAAELLRHPHLDKMYPIEALLSQQNFLIDALDPEASFRVRLIWLTGRLTYEQAAYQRAKKARLSPFKALYEGSGTTWLEAVSEICMVATRKVCE